MQKAAFPPRIGHSRGAGPIGWSGWKTDISGVVSFMALILRRIFLPVALATMAILFALLPVSAFLIGGPSVSSRLSELFSMSGAIVAASVLVGIVLVALPSARAMRRRRIHPLARVLLLLCAGMIGGAAIVMPWFHHPGERVGLDQIYLGLVIGGPAGVLSMAIWSITNWDLAGPKSAGLQSS